MKRNLIGPSELILNSDGSIYHLHLLPHQVAPTIITVGDPDRVSEVSSYFDEIEHRVQFREFVTHTGIYKGKQLTVVSTGIGTDNVDIVLNELDALFNIDLNSREVKEEFTALQFIRIGTSGALQPDIPLGTQLISSSAFGFDGLLKFYEGLETNQDEANRLKQHMLHLPLPYQSYGSSRLMDAFSSGNFSSGHTLTMPGFYAPQGRALRLGNPTERVFSKFADFQLLNGERLTNLEMETAGLYGLSEVLGHDAISLSVLLANRMNGEFHSKPQEAIVGLIEEALDIIVQL